MYIMYGSVPKESTLWVSEELVGRAIYHVSSTEATS